eukprot:Em0018g1010a
MFVMAFDLRKIRTLSFNTPNNQGLYRQGNADPTQLSALGLGSFALCLCTLAFPAADSLLVPTSFSVVELSGDTTVTSKAAGLPIIQLGTRMFAGRLSENCQPQSCDLLQADRAL